MSVNIEAFTCQGEWNMFAWYILELCPMPINAIFTWSLFLEPFMRQPMGNTE